MDTLGCHYHKRKDLIGTTLVNTKSLKEMRETVKAVLEERKLKELQQRFVDHMKSGGQPSLSLMLSKSNKKRMKVFSVQRQENASQSVKSFVST